MNVRICLPWRSDGAQRAELWRFCHRQWASLGLGWHICAADSGDEPFSRSRSRNQAAAGEWDVAVFADADIVVPTAEQVRKAVTLAAGSDCQVFGFDVKHMLSAEATRHALTGDEGALDPAYATDSSKNTLSSLFAINRSLWDRIGGYDERFVGWGFEDLCFVYAAETLGGAAQRVKGAVYDLWHPRQRVLQEGSATYPANEALWHRYLKVRYNPEGMASLIAETKVG